MNISISQKKKKKTKIYELLPIFSTNKERERKKKGLIRDKVGIKNAEIRVIK